MDVQRQLQRAEEWALHDLRQEKHRLQQAQETIFAALNGDTKLGGRLAPALARQLTRLAADTESVSAAGDRQADVVFRHAARLKQAERLERELAREERRTREKQELGDLLDVVAVGAREMVP